MYREIKSRGTFSMKASHPLKCLKGVPNYDKKFVDSLRRARGQRGAAFSKWPPFYHPPTGVIVETSPWGHVIHVFRFFLGH